MSEHRRHWRHYLIDKRLQLRYVGLVALLSLALCGLLGWLIWQQQNEASAAVRQSLASIDYLTPEDKALVVGHMQSADLNFVLVMAGVCFGLIAVLSLFLVVLTHKAAGPLYKIGQYLDDIAAGRLPVVHDLRRGDEFKRFFEKFKRMTESLRGRAEAEARAFGAFAAACGEAGLAGAGELGHALEELDELKREKEAAVA
ncbi:MAG TPA: methyl-accepting chemotaxis protein [Haliangiales bacterium]|nr:methyl-accepting chemotaxis protein [Haliangiales bacterium]